MPHPVQAFVFAKWDLACLITDRFTVDGESRLSCSAFLQETSGWCSADNTCAPSSKNCGSHRHHRLRRGVVKRTG